MSAYFIEVTKMSGMKTYFGPDMEELFYPKERLKDEWGYSSSFDAKDNIPKVEVNCAAMGCAVNKVVVVET